jgi:hypothetical protein
MAYDRATQWLLDQMHDPKVSMRHRIECAKTLLEVHGHKFDDVRWIRDPRDETVVTIKVIIGGIGPTAIDHAEHEHIAAAPSPARLN